MTLDLSGRRVTTAALWIPWRGAWVADLAVDLDADQPEPTGAMVFTAPATRVAGYGVINGSGRVGTQRNVRLVGGARGGWSSLVSSRHHHNDGGVRLSHVLSTLAAEVGERVAVLTDEVLGVDYVRPAGLAGQALDGRSWWVDAEGVAQVGERTVSAAPAGIEVLDFDPVGQVVKLEFDKILPGPGMRVTSSLLPGPVVLRDCTVTWAADGQTIASCTVQQVGKLDLRSAMQALVGDRRAPFSRCYRYRVIGTTAKRHDLQAVRKAPGLPDVVSLSAWPGVPGVDAVPTPGAEVLVEFIDGDPAQPCIRAFEGPEGDSYAARSVAIDATEEIRLGGSSAQLVALASAVDANFDALLNLLQNWLVVANDGGLALQTAANLVTLPSVAASKTFAE